MKISEIIRDKYKLRIPPTVYYDLLADVREVEEEQEPTTKIDCNKTDCNKCVNHKYCDYEPTTKNDLGVEKIVDVLGSYTDLDIPYKHKIAEDILNNLPSVIPQEPKWIPVSERLPKIADVYRVTRYYRDNVMNPQYLVDACCFDGSTTWYNDNRINHERAHADNVIAWQENPEPYKVDPQESEVKE